MSTKNENIIDPGSCWNRAEPDEPVFVLRAHDEIASEIVIMWANRYLIAKGGWARMTEAQRNKYNHALADAQRMREWHTGQRPDDDIPF